jgi:regulator of RNase E activity RraA
MTGQCYLERTDWWSALERIPVPRIAVIQDTETGTGLGSAAGEVHAAILKAFRCEGIITNGSVRDVPRVSRMGFPMFARSVSVSHSYHHVVEYDRPVEILGLEIHPGDLLYADCHGVISIPLEIAAELPAAAERIRAHEQGIIAVCQSRDFSPEKLLKAIHSTD